MSQIPPQQPVIIQAPQSNHLGLAGFICSIAGVVLAATTGIGGILLPVGLILSLIALGREPRGFAIAGAVIGGLGTCFGVILVVIFGAAILAMIGLAAAAISMTDVEQSKMSNDMLTAAAAIRAYEDENDYPPAQLSLLDLDPDILTDPWGNRYEYLLIDEAPGFDFVSLGADGTLGTADDLRLSELGETWQAGGLGIHVADDDDSGRVRIRIGNRTITATGDDDSGRVEIDLGDRVIEIVGDDEGGRIDVKPTAGGGATDVGDAESEPAEPAEAPAEAPPVPEAPPEAAEPAAPSASLDDTARFGDAVHGGNGRADTEAEPSDRT